MRSLIRHPTLLPVTLTLLVAVVGCGPAPHSKPPPRPPPTDIRQAWFEEVTADSGVRFTHDPDARGHYRLPEHIGSGLALFDFNNDQRLDLYLVQNGGPDSTSTNRLYAQQPDGSFLDVSAGSGLDITGWGMGAYAGDVNNDGWTDLLVTEYGTARLFLNQAGTSFLEVTQPAGLINPRWATAASFLDYDRDGWLDLVVGNYVDFDPTHECYDEVGRRDYCGLDRVPPTITRLFHNEGPHPLARPPGLEIAVPRFTDVTVPSGLVHHPGQALGVACLDLNGDHWPDILLADDMLPNRVFINRQNGTFTEEGAARGLAYTALGQVAADMGIALGDVNRNGLFDIFITHLTSEFHNLWIHHPQGLFQDKTAAAGLTDLSPRTTGFGTVMGDFDLDGAPDIALVNGHIKRSPAPPENAPAQFLTTPFWQPYAQPAQLLRNDGTGRFEDISSLNANFSHPRMVGRGLAAGDLDNDGNLDLVSTCIAGPARLFRNVAGDGRHWLSVRGILPAHGGRDAIGAEIHLLVQGQTQVRLLQPALGYLSNQDPRVHFGLGASTTYDGITVVWPDGQSESFPRGAANRHLILQQGSGTAIPTSTTP